MAKKPARARAARDGRVTPKGTQPATPKPARTGPTVHHVERAMPVQGRAFVARPLPPRSGHRGRR
jgi:hypothetical protein